MGVCSTNQVRIEPVFVKWEIEQKECIDFVSQAQGQYNGTYFTLGNEYYVWFNLDSGSTDPAPSGLTGISVAVSTGDSATTIASAAATAIDANANYSAIATQESVTITRADTSTQKNITDGTVATGLKFYLLQEGGSLDLGLLQGDVETSFEEDILDINAHSTGTTIVNAVRRGVSAEVSLTMLEGADVDKLKEIFASTGGDTYTPASGTEVFGWGTSRQGDSVLPQSRRLNLHPVNADTDLTRDLTFWKAYPMPDSLVYSGENPKTISISFRVFVDKSKRKEVSLFVFGDYTQNLSA